MRRPLSLALLCLLAALPAAAKKVEQHYDIATDFSAYSSWSWGEPQERPEGHTLAVGGALDTKLRGLIEAELESKGLRLEEAGEGDLRVVYRTTLTESVTSDGAHIGLTDRVSWDFMTSPPRAFSEGTLLIEITDAASGELVWSGWASEVADKPATLEKKAGKAVKRILRHFPP